MLFIGRYKFLANDYRHEVPVNVPGVGKVTFPNVEAALLAAKLPTDQIEEFALYSYADPMWKVREYAASLARPEVTDEALDGYMDALLRHKFSDPELAAQLIEVKGEIHMDNPRHDTYWGRVKGEGEDRVGYHLTRLRDELKAAA